MAKSKSTPPPAGNDKATQEVPDAKLAAIKEILFGENIRDFEQEFAELKRILEEIHAEMKEEVANARNDLEMMVQSLEAENDKQHENLRSWADGEFTRLSDEKLDRSLLGDLLEDIGKKIKA